MALTPVPVVELVEDWLTAKRALGSAAQAAKGNSDRPDARTWSAGPLRSARPKALHRRATSPSSRRLL